jgi:hypothetical protein
VRRSLLARASLGATAAFVLAGAIAQPVFACTTDVEGLRDVSEGRGFTFVARVVSVEAVHDPNLPEEQKLTTFAVERVFAGDVPNELAWLSDICHEPRDFVVGGRYLLSTSAIDQPTVEQLVAWRMTDNRLRLVDFEIFSYYPPAIRRIVTLSDAIALMVGDIPETSTETPSPLRSDSRDVLVMLAAGVLSLAAVRGLRRHYSN